MQNVKVLSGQSLFDIANQYTGDAINTYPIAKANGKSITDDLNVGEIIIIPNEVVIASRELKYLTSLEIKPATGITLEHGTILTPELGIGTMAIETTFIVG